MSVAQVCPTLWDPIDSSLPRSSAQSKPDLSQLLAFQWGEAQRWAVPPSGCSSALRGASLGPQGSREMLTTLPGAGRTKLRARQAHLTPSCLLPNLKLTRSASPGNLLEMQTVSSHPSTYAFKICILIRSPGDSSPRQSLRSTALIVQGRRAGNLDLQFDDWGQQWWISASTQAEKLE